MADDFATFGKYGIYIFWIFCNFVFFIYVYALTGCVELYIKYLKPRFSVKNIKIKNRIIRIYTAG